MSQAVAYIDDLMTEYARKLLAHPYFPHLMSICIIGHIVAMASGQHDAQPEWVLYAETAYVVFSIVFAGELLVRILAFASLQTFLSTKINVFEAVMVTTGVMGLVANWPTFRLIPALRLYRLMRYLPTLEHLLELAIGSLKPMSNLLVFVIIVSLAVAVTGRYVFGEKMSFTRSNFSTFSEAMITVFQLFTGSGL